MSLELGTPPGGALDESSDSYPISDQLADKNIDEESSSRVLTCFEARQPLLMLYIAQRRSDVAATGESLNYV